MNELIGELEVSEEMGRDLIKGFPNGIKNTFMFINLKLQQAHIFLIFLLHLTHFCEYFLYFFLSYGNPVFRFLNPNSVKCPRFPYHRKFMALD